MSGNTCLKWYVTALVLAAQLSGGLAGAVTIDTVPVGNPGNVGDTQSQGTFGAVGYEYNIGKYGVTAGQYVEFLNAVAKTDPYGLYNASMNSSTYGCQITWNTTSNTYDFSGKPGSTTDAGWADRPVNYVSWGDAARFANWLHNGQPTGTLTGTPAQDAGLTEDGSYYLNGAMTNAELLAVSRKTDATWVIPTEDEWYKAAYHDETAALAATYFNYPTGSNSEPSNDLVDPTDPGNNANFYQSGYTIGSPYYSTLVGEFENSESPYGTFDQGGNVFEWNEAAIGSSRGLRGGYWDYSSSFLAASSRGSSYPAFEYNTIGFRVASSVAIPEPGSITLLVCGLLGCLVCWRRRR